MVTTSIVILILKYLAIHMTSFVVSNDVEISSEDLFVPSLLINCQYSECLVLSDGNILEDMLLYGVIFRIKDYYYQKGKGITETPKEHQRNQKTVLRRCNS